MKTSLGPMAIMTPHKNTLTETSIHRYMRDLLPDRTVLIVDEVNKERQEVFPSSEPTLVCAGWPTTKSFPESLDGLGYSYGIRMQQVAPVARFLKAHKVKFIFSQHLNYSLPWLPLAKDLDVNFYVRAHGYDVSATLRKTAMAARYKNFNEARGVIVMSEYSRKLLLELGVDAQKIKVVPYGVDVPSKAPPPVESDTVIKCIAVGRLVPKKSPLLLLKAFLSAARQRPELHLDMVGDGPLQMEARSFVAFHDLHDHVKFHGELEHDKVIDLVEKSHIFLQHSCTAPDGDQEGLPVSILEAMSRARPVISTRHAGIPEAVIHGETGLLSDEGDTESMARQILQLAHDGKMRNALGLAGWRRSARYFSWEREKEELLKIFSDS